MFVRRCVSNLCGVGRRRADGAHQSRRAQSRPLPTSPSACTQVLLAGGAAAAAVAAARWAVVGAAAQRPAAAVGAALLPATVRSVLERSGARALASGQAQLPARIALPTLVAAHACSRAVSVHVLGFHNVAHHLRLQHWVQQEEVPLAGRRRPALPVLTDEERETRVDPAATEAMLRSSVGPGAGKSARHMACTPRMALHPLAAG